MRIMMLVLLALGLMLASAAVAQQPSETETPQATLLPTFDFFAARNAALTPTPSFPLYDSQRNGVGSLRQLSLSGVGATPIDKNVSIRQGPGLNYPRIGVLRSGKSIDVVGTNGYDQTRSCIGEFSLTLDMWIQVQFNERRGWIARCTVVVTGDTSRLLVQTPP